MMIAILSPQEKVTSESLSESIGRNPVEIRKIFSGLKAAGIIGVSRGTGGTILLKAPSDLNLFDIYSAVDTMPLSGLIGIHENPSKQCVVGRNIAVLLAEPYAKVSNAVRQAMSSTTLAQLIQKLYQIEPMMEEMFPQKCPPNKSE
jgi:DNA-binding IscR family transcriptional regulator